LRRIQNDVEKKEASARAEMLRQDLARENLILGDG